MSQSINSHRRRAFTSQGGRCYYCTFPIWLADLSRFAAAYGFTERQALRLRCTAEHLHPRSAGGSNRRENIVAACRFCNAARHRRAVVLEPERFRKYVLGRIVQRRWHPKNVHVALDAWRSMSSSVEGRGEGSCSSASNVQQPLG
jgi:5-methylcytosine-specific restriction endonuclease McrA